MNENVSKIGAATVGFIISFACIWFFFRPELNIRSSGTWGFALICFIVGIIFSWFTDFIDDVEISNVTATLTLILVVLVLVLGVGRFAGTKIVQSRKSQKRLDIAKDVSTFEDTVEEFNFDSIPRIDASVAINLANRKLGELEDVISQFEADETHSTLINYQGKPFRIIPLKYGGFFKYLSNKENGIPGFIKVDLINQKAEYVKLEDGIKYAPSAYFSCDLNKHIRSEYPSSITGEYNFEIDENGVPYWVISEITPTAFISGVKIIKNVIVLNAITGEMKRYPISEIPTWIDRAFDTETVLDQIDSWGKYVDGFINSLDISSQKGVKQSTSLYNFIIQNDDVYLYTGITSANSSDHSNIGFCLVNMRTGEAKYTSCPSSVDESSAKSSAETIYQEKGYVATDPLLVKVTVDDKSIPTYCTSLKDNAGLVKVYAFVCATDYKIVGYASEQEGMEKALENYKKALNGESFNTDAPSDNGPDKDTKQVELETISFSIDSIKEITINGTTAYYILSDKKDIIVAPITANMSIIPNLKVGDNVTAEVELINDYYLVHTIEEK